MERQTEKKETNYTNTEYMRGVYTGFSRLYAKVRVVLWIIVMLISSLAFFKEKTMEFSTYSLVMLFSLGVIGYHYWYFIKPTAQQFWNKINGKK